MTSSSSSIPAGLSRAVDLSSLAHSSHSTPSNIPPEAVLIDESNFEAEILAKSLTIPVVVILWSPRSSAACQLVDTFAQLARQNSQAWALAIINIDTTPQLAQIFGVEIIPTVIAFAAGQPLTSFQGPQPEAQLQRWIRSLLDAVAGKLPGAPTSQTTQPDPRLMQARKHLREHHFDQARSNYEAFLVDHPDDTEARTALKMLDLLQRASQYDRQILTRAQEDPTDLDALCQAAEIQILDGDIAGAFERLIDVIAATSGEQRTKVRTHLLTLFEAFEPDHPHVSAARRHLANVLY